MNAKQKLALIKLGTPFTTKELDITWGRYKAPGVAETEDGEYALILNQKVVKDGKTSFVYTNISDDQALHIIKENS